MAQHMPEEALGFPPTRETTEVWLPLQAQIELFMQHNLDLTGLSTDLKRAFNNIGRRQVFLVAKRLGLPHQRPWEKFLNKFVRRFDINAAWAMKFGPLQVSEEVVRFPFWQCSM